MISDHEPIPAAARQHPSLDQSDQAGGMLSNSEFLTAEEMIRRRHRRVMQLSRVYRDHYWGLIDDLRRKYRDYLWNFGSPFVEGDRESQVSDLGIDKGKIDALGSSRCARYNCNKKAMAMTRFCHSHILSDPKQVLYKGCAFATSKRKSMVQTVCGKPILRSTTPSFCNYHLSRAKKSVARSLKEAGLSIGDSNRMAPMIHIIGAEFVREILRKRRGFKKSTANVAKIEENTK